MASSMEVVAMDCEMVGLGPLRESGLARCSLVDLEGTVLYDKFIRPEGQITDYRTRVSGVTPQLMEGATPFSVARQEVSEGHAARHLQTPSPCAHSPGGRQAPRLPPGLRPGPQEGHARA
ncbi:Interferon-stimulated gene 20 kDa protein [Galemys pyrenaicus]|uniref:Interferon-stimulated gene 20 kDa protein n=1 Tax=Galemys pyrenaicus TaxID=202257 RepID=A0A8J6ABH5_GALPY|nr:Interferon-stimulated gene 20 kDa protein [Galemys pyrenaicus]